MSAATGNEMGMNGVGSRQEIVKRLRGVIEPGVLSGAQNLAKLAGGDQDYFNQLEAPAKRQFQGIQGQIASRFSGMGTGARRSSGHQLEQSGAASNFAEQLQSQRLNLQQNAYKQLLGLYGGLMDYDEPQEETGWDWGGAASGALTGATAGSSFGPWGVAAGGLVGGISGLFSKKSGYSPNWNQAVSLGKNIKKWKDDPYVQ